MTYPIAPTTQNLPSCCQFRTERSDATRRGRAGWRVAAGRPTVARERSFCSSSGCGDTLGLDRRARRPNLPDALVLLHDERLDVPARQEQEVAQLAELASPAHHGVAQQP